MAHAHNPSKSVVCRGWYIISVVNSHYHLAVVLGASILQLFNISVAAVAPVSHISRP